MCQNKLNAVKNHKNDLYMNLGTVHQLCNTNFRPFRPPLPPVTLSQIAEGTWEPLDSRGIPNTLKSIRL